MGPMWEALIFTTPGLENGKLELLLWRYVDGDVKDDPP